MISRRSRSLRLRCGIFTVSRHARAEGHCIEALRFAVVNAQDPSSFDWTALNPSTALSWVDCYTGLQCTRLQVPLNYSEPTGSTAAIAVIRLPSKLAPSDENYRGPVLFNPGGPGGSGVDELVASGPALASIIGSQFDLVSFDPRGIGRSTPLADFLTSELAKAFWDYSSNFNVVNHTLSTSSIPRLWAQSQVLGHLAQKVDTGILSHITTDNVAHDMLSIVEAHNETQLQYWGVSYGSVLGSTFATLFPDKVGRLIIDGVLDMDAYFSGRWEAELADTDKVLQVFFDSCFAAGQSACPFYASSSSQIQQNMNALLDSVAAQPVPVHFEPTNSYGIVDGATLKFAIKQALYSPYSAFPVLADGLADLAVGNGTTILGMVSSFTRPPTCNETEDITFDSEIAVSCGDFVKIEDTPAELQTYYESIQNVSIFADVLLPQRVVCSGWQIHTDSFKGPTGGNTSFPLLVIGNTADPVTPLRAAVKTSSGFNNSVVLVQDGAGHTSLAANSLCTAGYIAAYFANGTLPANGTVCPIEDKLFGSSFKLSARSFLGAGLKKKYARKMSSWL
ncbi:TAP-like protein-domain-containing protein [Mycena floridula]|nr:TAP-like protein-domain-containing protein [Mycena floridula]